MKPGRIVRTATFRITAFYVLVFVGSLLLISAAFYFAGTEIWEQSIRGEVQDEHDLLMRSHESGGVEALAREIAPRARPVGDEGLIYLLLSPDGQKQAGQLAALPMEKGWQEIAPPWGEEDEPFFALGTVLPDGSYFLVGRDAHDLHDALEFVEEGLPIALAVALPLALLGGLIVSALILRRLEAINRATLEIRRGHLDKRIPRSGTNDEFDQLAAHLNAMLDGIEDLTEGIRQVSNDIAHDLRTPLTRVANMVEAARRNPPSQAETQELLDGVAQELKRLLEAFAAMLRIAQMDAGTLRPSFALFDLSQALSELAQDFEPLASDAGLKLEAEIEPGIWLHGERRLIVQMFVNLIENAITHSKGDALTLSLKRRNGAAIAVVRDSGVGIPAAEHEQVFQRFHRLDKSRRSDGFGLGLSLVAAVAKLHAIGITLSDARPGLAVTLRFPKTARNGGG